jgi:Swt1-like HEPN
MEPSAAIAVIETDLRHLVRVVLEKAHGSDWLAKNLDAATIHRLQERLEEERKRRAPAKVSSDLMAYTHLYELRTVIEKNWQEFSPALGEKKEFVVLMDKVEDFRNAPAHSRELLPHERSLLDGIAGTVRTQVAMYVSSQDPDKRHYPVIESIRDSFGNEPTPESMKFNPLLDRADAPSRSCGGVRRTRLGPSRARPHVALGRSFDHQRFAKCLGQ